MYSLKREILRIPAPGREMRCVLLRPKAAGPVPGILWIHGGGYVLGMAAMADFSVGKRLARRFGAVVLSPEYRRAKEAPYPAAFDDCCSALEYLHDHAEELGVDPRRLIVGGESAGGGLAAAVCLWARDRGRIPVAYQIPLYPMLDCRDTETSRNNHARVWNTRRNHWGWRWYLREDYGTDRVDKYASPARETDYTGLPPCRTYIEDGEPFYAETLAYVRALNGAGVPAGVDVFPGATHGFDYLFWTKNARQAKARLCADMTDFFTAGQEG